MNTKSAIIALILALLGITGAFFLLKPESPAVVERTWLASLDVSRVERVKVEWPDGSSASLEPSQVPTLWLLRHGATVWPVKSSRVHAALKLLSGVDSGEPSTEGRTNGAAVTVTVGGQDHRLRLSDEALGGRTLVKIEGKADAFRLVDAQVARLFESNGLLAWRESTLFSTEEFSRIRLQTIGRQIALGRVAGRWGVQIPVAAPADQEACARLVETLLGLNVQRFIDQLPADEKTLGLENPQALIDTETDFRVMEGGDVKRTLLLQQLKIGGPADASGERLFASMRAQWLDPTTRSVTTAWGPALGVVSRADLNALSAELTVYVSKQTVQASGVDVSRVTIMSDDHAMEDSSAASGARKVVIERSLDEWRLTPEHGAARSPSASERAGIAALLRVLTEQRADGIGREPPRDATGFVRLKVEALAANAEVGVGTAMVVPATGGAREPREALVLRVGGIYRVYFGEDATALARWLKDLLPPEG